MAAAKSVIFVMEGYQRHCPTSVMGPRSCQSQCQFVKDLLVTGVGLGWETSQEDAGGYTYMYSNHINNCSTNDKKYIDYETGKSGNIIHTILIVHTI